MKYPIEIELTDHCTLACDCCPNKDYESKAHMADEDFYDIIEYIKTNREKILFLDLCGIWDIFLHPNITHFLRYIADTFENSDLNILIPTKWTVISDKHIEALQYMKNKNINFNLSVWFYSMRRKVHDSITGKPNFDDIMKFIKICKKNNFPLSLEMLINKFSLKELDYFYKFWDQLQLNYKVHNYHNFWGSVDRDNIYEYNKNDYKFKCSFADDETYKLDFYCQYTLPFIARDWYLFSCSHWGKQEKYRTEKFSQLMKKYPNFEDLLKYITEEKLTKSICKNCTYFKY